MSPITRFYAAGASVIFLALVGACSEPENDATASGGSTSVPSTTGGSVTTGGNVATGGRGATGGSVATGGGAATGGSVATGGRAATEGEPTLFYLDLGDSRVVKAAAEDPQPTTVVSRAGEGPDGIAIDLARGHLFWTNMGVPADDDGSVRRADLDGSNVTTIVPEGETYTPKQLKLEPATQKLYWSDREGMRVQRSNLDGSELETLITIAEGAAGRRDPANFCVGIALDASGGWFYWTQKGGDNEGVGTIWRAHLDMPAGQDAETRDDAELLFDGLPEPIDLEVDVEAGYLYWTDRGDDTVNRAPIAVPGGVTAATRDDREILVEGVREAIGIALDRRRGHVYYTGALGQVGRVNLDGTGGESLLSNAGVLTGITVVDLP